MKLSNCNEHPNENNPDLPCWALRHEDGRRATPEEIISAIDAAVIAERDACAKVCDERAEMCAAKAETTDDQDDRTELKANAWQFSVLGAEIRKRSNVELSGREGKP